MGSWLMDMPGRSGWQKSISSWTSACRLSNGKRQGSERDDHFPLTSFGAWFWKRRNENIHSNIWLHYSSTYFVGLAQRKTLVSFVVFLDTFVWLGEIERDFETNPSHQDSLTLEITWHECSSRIICPVRIWPAAQFVSSVAIYFKWDILLKFDKFWTTLRN